MVSKFLATVLLGTTIASSRYLRVFCRRQSWSAQARRRRRSATLWQRTHESCAARRRAAGRGSHRPLRGTRAGGEGIVGLRGGPRCRPASSSVESSRFAAAASKSSPASGGKRRPAVARAYARASFAPHRVTVAEAQPAPPAARSVRPAGQAAANSARHRYVLAAPGRCGRRLARPGRSIGSDRARAVPRRRSSSGNEGGEGVGPRLRGLRLVGEQAAEHGNTSWMPSLAATSRRTRTCPSREDAREIDPQRRGGSGFGRSGSGRHMPSTRSRPDGLAQRRASPGLRSASLRHIAAGGIARRAPRRLRECLGDSWHSARGASGRRRRSCESMSAASCGMAAGIGTS